MFDMWQQLHESISNGCGRGLESEVTGGPVRKSRRIITSSQKLADRLRRSALAITSTPRSRLD